MGANLPPVAGPFDTPMVENIQFGTGHAVGTVNVGDFLVYSGHKIVPTAMAANGGNAAAVKASAAGIAMEASPRYDRWGATAENTGLLFARYGRFRVTGHYNMTASGDVALGTPVFPISTGSGVGAPTAQTGVGAKWATAAHVLNSAYSGVPALGVAQIVGVGKLAAGYGATGSGVAQLDIILLPARPDYL